MERGTYSNSPVGLTLRTKMALLTMSACAGILVVGVISLFMMNEVRIGGAAYRTIQKDKDALESIALLKSDLFQINSETRNFIVTSAPIATEKKIAAINDLTNDIELNFGIVRESVGSAAERATVDKAEAVWKEYQHTLQADVLPAVARGDRSRANLLVTGIQTERFDIFSKAVAQMVKRIRLEVSATERQVTSNIQAKTAITTVITAAVIALIVLFSYFITTSITRPLRNCVDFARSLAGGRLDGRLDVRGGGEAADLAHAMNIMANNLHSVVSRIGSASGELISIDKSLEKAAYQAANSAQMQVQSVLETSQAVTRINESVHGVYVGIDTLSESATETSSSSLEMAATIEELAMNAEKLGDSVEDVSSSIAEMTVSIKEIDSSIVNLLDASTTTATSIAEMDATIKQVEKNALDSAAISETVRSDAEIGKNAVLESIAGMQAIRASSRTTSEAVETLSLRVKDIGTILSVIDEVAEQTNLLALNAAIIAAQAGEHGKGFAVVADEIRDLAERTSSSTREIAAVITGVQEETRRAVDAINRAEESIVAGEQLSQRSGAALEKIVAGVQRAGIQVGEIAKATVDQTRGSQNIREAMKQMEYMVGTIATSARTHSRGTDVISAAVERMKDLTVHVRTSTREQSKASTLIARSAEKVTTMVDQIREACRLQVDSSALISRAVSNIEGATVVGSQATQAMNTAVADLTTQIDLLEKEMAGFRI